MTEESANPEKDTQYLLSVLEKIRSRLLDQTRRNRLLNYKESARDIAIIDEMPDQVHEHLVQNGGSFYFDPYKEEDDQEDQINLLVNEEEAPPDRTLPRSTHKEPNAEKRYTDNRLQTPFTEKELERRLRKLHLEHRTIIQETGANNLYLATGFLQWYDSRDNPLALRSPLILLPVRLERERISGKARYRLIFDDEALDTNYSLYEKLKHDFDITLPFLSEEQSPESYWREVEEAVLPMQRDGWTLLREMSLGLFRFNKQVLWNDLDYKRWPAHSALTDKPILNKVLMGSSGENSAPCQLTQEYSSDNDMDEESKPALSLIRDADSSQYSALVDALEHDGLVIEGPPGTGKSQTITNLIASALDQGLTVLFVAEKMAALDVVYRRLDESGLGNFCLQLHGLKTNKKELLQSVFDRLKHDCQKPIELERHKTELEDTKKELIEFSHALTTTVGPKKLPLHRLAWRIEVLIQSLPADFQAINVKNADEIRLEAFSRAKNLLNDLGKEWLAIPQEAREAWRGFLPEKYEESQAPLLESEISKVIKAVERLESWLNDHQALDFAPTLFETRRLLILGELDLEHALPPFPSGSDMELGYTIIKFDLFVEFHDLLQNIADYLGIVNIVNEVFDYQAEDSATYTEKLKLHAGRLIDVVCNGNVTIGELPRELQLISGVIDHLESMQDIAAPVMELVDRFARTTDDYRYLAKQADNLTGGPAHLSLHGMAFHAKASAKNYLVEAKEQAKVLTNKSERLTFFNFDRTWETKSLCEAQECIVENKDKWLVLFNGRYRRAKKFVKALLKDPKLFSRKPDFLDELSKLVEFSKEIDKFRNNEDFRLALGDLFKGVETDWKALTHLIDFSHSLREKIGLEKAQTILADWDSHMERMQSASDRLNKAINAIDEYAGSHPFPGTLWPRPVVEISGTLKPWRVKLQTAIDSIAQNWCQQNSSLQRTLEAVDAFRRAKAHELDIERHEHYDALLGNRWEGAATNVSTLNAVYSWVKKRLDIDCINLEILRWLMPTPDEVRYDLFKELVSEAKEYRNAISEQVAQFKKIGAVTLKDWMGGGYSKLFNFQRKLNKCIETVSSIPLMVRWQIVHEQVCELGLKELADTVSAGTLQGEACGNAFEYSVYKKILEDSIASNPKLAAFGHTRFESLRDRFAQLDKELLQLNAKKIAARLCKSPAESGMGYGPVKNYTEKSLLIHEIGKKKRHIPIRQLVRRAGNALQALKPCFLMSPLSVAQYLAPGEIEFDLVVMDEASQIRPEDALGAIARGRKTVIVGDPKQLPPTSFFDTAVAEDEEKEETIVDDTESILDVCLKRFPYRRLRWHYRSQHESLIHFSNNKFYDGDLIVFPSPKGDSREFGVHSTFIDNPSYHKGRNRGEVEIVVENIIHHFHHHKKKSLGVAAFNKRQAEEIELLLDKARSEDPAIDDLIRQHEAEDPLFIKNLENVQGDERDVIFISTTYGPEKQGAPVFQRFGPINSDLGWRRLNVIATRARQRVEVFTSMQPTDIRLGDGTRRGVRAFRDYLEYAGTGEITEHGVPTGREPDSDFEEAVARILSDLGYECDPQVGVSGFYIDIGVRHPDRQGEFLMGIECDGATYHSARSVRDRDRLRQEILESKGWYIHRIWSTSWFHTRAAEIDRLKRTLGKRLEEERKLWKQLEDYEDKTGALAHAHHATTNELKQEEEEISESLKKTLERFWEENIKPQFPHRDNSILSEKMIGILVEKQPDNENQWFAVIPMKLREQMDPKQKAFLWDILDAIAEYV